MSSSPSASRWSRTPRCSPPLVSLRYITALSARARTRTSSSCRSTSAFGRRAVTHAPSFFFPQLIEAAGGRCAVAYDWDELAAAIGHETTLVLVNTPVNPTGYVFRASDLDAIAAALEGYDALLLSDEA